MSIANILFGWISNNHLQTPESLATHAEEVFAKLSQLPQFVQKENHLVNLMTGCNISVKNGGLYLNWGSTFSNTECSKTILYNEQEIAKFMNLMVKQAAMIESA